MTGLAATRDWAPWRLKRWGKPSGRALGCIKYEALVPDTRAGRKLNHDLNRMLIEASYIGLRISILVEEHDPE